KPFNRIEHAYAQLAREAGIEMPEIRLLEQDCNAHLMVRRFDRSGHQRVHMHSLGGLHHADYNSPGEFSYEQFLRTILTLNLGYPTLDQAFRRAVFNIVAVNQDDHVKNISFLMNDDGDWRLAPAYDLTFARGEGYTRLHQMSLNGKRERFKLQDLVDFGAKMGINRDGREVIEEVVEALSNWSTYASAAGVPEDMITAIGKEHRFCK
ncbi:MAG: type II toxin-antitoxin system HipA family toxin, partial [Gemmatimonadales bacterium]